MIEDGRYCAEILQQSNCCVSSSQSNILGTHLNNCVKEAFSLRNKKDIEEKILELKDIFKKY